jgi:hypothetical protein
MDGMFMVYLVRDMLRGAKKEMDEKGLSFDELLEKYEEVVRVLGDAPVV